jgi:hypothetical protein
VSSLDEPITGSAARWLRILWYVLVAPFVAFVALCAASAVAGTVFGVVPLVVIAVEHGAWFIPAGVIAAWTMCVLVAWRWF